MHSVCIITHPLAQFFKWLQENIRELRSKQETTDKQETPTIEMVDFKTKFAETKAHAKVKRMRNIPFHW